MGKKDLRKQREEILITSSHRPSRRVRSFINDLAKTLPKAVRINRGKKSLEDLKDLARLAGYKVILIVSTWKANPGRIDVYLREDDMFKKAGSLYISSTKLSREQRTPNCFFRSPHIVPGECVSETCRNLIDILNSILKILNSNNKPNDKSLDEKIYIDVSEKTYIWFSKGGRICGPRIGIRSAYRETQSKNRGYG